LAVVLLADDDPDARQLLAQLLVRRGHVVRTVADGYELVRTYMTLTRSGQPPGVIVTDIDMPGSDGVAAVRRLRDAGVDVPVVFITGKSSAEQLAEARRMGWRCASRSMSTT
jgi:CheY-like chemotaxis protein